MRRTTIICLLLAVATGPTGAATISQQSSEQAQAVIAGVIEAYGGEARLGDIKSLLVTADTLNVAVDQSRKPEPPWDENDGWVLSAVDLEQGIFVNHVKGAGGGFEFETGTIINGEEGYQLDYRADTAAPITEPDFDNSSGPLVRITPLLLVKQLMERSDTSHYLGTAEVDGRPHDVITLVMRVGPALSLYVDRASHLITRSERILRPFGLVEYRFEDYDAVDGVPMPQRFVLLVNGERNLEWRYMKREINASLAQRARVPEKMARIPGVTPDDLSLQELADDVYLVGGTGTYALFVDAGDYLAAIGGTAGIPERIAEVRKVVGDKPVRYGVMTHHHSDHVLGAPAYVEEGATIVAARDHEDVVGRAVGDAGEPEFLLVDDAVTLGEGEHSVRVIDIGSNPHTEHMLVAWLPARRILFHADMIATPQTGPMPPAVSNTAALAEAIQRNGLDVKTLVSAHSPRVIGTAEMHAALDRRRELLRASNR